MCSIKDSPLPQWLVKKKKKLILQQNEEKFKLKKQPDELSLFH